MKKSFKNVLFWLISLSLFYTLSGFVILPWWARTQLPSLLKEKINLPMSVEKVTFNPFTFELHVNNLALKDHAENNVTCIEHLYLNYEPLLLFKKEFFIKSLLISKPFADLKIDENGTLNLLTLFPNTSSPENNETSNTPLTMPFIIGHVEIQHATVNFSDQSAQEPFHIAIGPMHYTANNLSFYKDDLSVHALQIALQNEEKISLASSMSLEPLKFHGELTVKNLSLNAFWSYLLPTIPAKLDEGTLFLRIPFLIDLSKESPHVFIEKANADLENIVLMDGDKKVIKIPSFKVNGIDFDLQESRINIDNALILDPFVDLHLDKNYMPNIMHLFIPKNEKKNQSATHEKTPNKNPWKFALKSLGVNNASIDITDHNVKSEPAHFSSFTFKTNTITHDMNQPISYEMNTTLDKTAHIALKGSVVPATMHVTLDMHTKALSLAKAHPYLIPFTTLILKEGLLSLNANMQASFGTKPFIKIAGDMEISKLSFLDRFQKTIMAWEKLNIDSIDYSSSPSSLHVKNVFITKPYVNLDIKKDQSTNFSHLTKPTPKASSHKTTTSKEAPMHIVIGNITMKQGSANFKDASLPIPFATFITRLNGNFSKLDTKNSKPSILKLEGKVDKYGYAKIDSSILPFDFKNRANLKIIFKNLDMTSFTPYSGKFVGYAIKEGKLSMDLSYKIRKGLMEGDNKINLDSLTLGEKIESEDAVNLPLGLAIAILKDSKGQIDINLPVSGDMNSPEFRYGSIVWRAIGNLIGSIVTSPFKLLGSMLGIETENLKSVDFAAGEYALIESEEEKMEQYQQILEKRAELKLLITPSFNEIIDTQALKEQNVTAQLEILSRKNSKTEDSYSKTIQKLFLQKYSKELYNQLLKTYKEENLARGVINERLIDKIAETIPVNADDLNTLAHKRAEAIIQNLITKHKIAPERLLKQEVQPSEALRDQWIGCAISVSN